MNRNLFSILLVIIPVFFSNNVIQAKNTITGTIKDSISGEPLAFAQVSILQVSDTTLINGAITDYEGIFSFQTAGSGIHLLRVNFVGYEDFYKQLYVESGKNDLGIINITPSVTQLGEVEITAAASLFRGEADRRVYNVENMTIAEGGTAIQLLEALPSVQLDEEGSIMVRGSGNILIYINGRPTNLTADDTESILEQYPANDIKSIELITNPSARFDAEGVGGIINLILKEERMHGFNGQVNMSAGTGNKYTGGINMNLRRNRWNLFANYSYQYRELWEKNESFQERDIMDSSPIVDLDYQTENYLQSHLVRIGGEYEFNSNSSARVYSNINARGRDRERTYNISNLSAPLVLDSMYVRLLEEDQSRVNYETGLGYYWNDQNGRSFNTNASISWSSQDRIEYFNQQYFDSNMEEVEEKLQDQFYERPLDSRMMVFEIDYEQILGENVQLESGLKGTLRHDYREQNFGQLNLSTDEYEEVVLSGIPINNSFTRDEDVYAGYLIIRNNNSRLSYLAGLRAEMTYIKTHQEYGLRPGFLDDDHFVPSTDTTTRSNYFNLFPSIFLNYEISENQDIQANYSRRIRRPGVTAMMPFLNAQDFYNLRLGNPYLEPAYTNSYEINYIRSWENYMVTGGVFHRHTYNGITRLFVPFEQGAMVTWVNASTINSTGLELINYFTFNSNFDLTLSGNYFYSLVEGQLEDDPYKNESYSYTLSLLGNMSIPGWFNTQVSANYWGPRVIPQGTIKPVFTMNIGLRRNVLNNQGTVSLNVSDLLNTRRFKLETSSDAIVQKREFYRESRIITLSFTYRFRNYPEQRERRREDSIEGDIEGLF